MGSKQMHFGLNFQHREFQSNNGSTTPSSSGQPSAGQVARYRARPFSQLTDVRFVDTGNFAARGDNIFGVEAAGIFKSLHVAAEGQYTKVDAYGPGDTFDAEDTLDLFPGSTSGTTTSSFYVPDGNPSFWGGYVEAGYFLTGETRGYKNGAWDRTKVLKSFSKGGWGAVQVNARLDYLDLDSGKLKRGCTNNFLSLTLSCTGSGSGANFTKGGKQLGLLGSIVWIPEDYLRLYLQYSHATITGGPFADEVEGVSSSTPDLDDEKYGVDALTTRLQIDF
jgi:phosphate-selective porin OprO/OprP